VAVTVADAKALGAACADTALSSSAARGRRPTGGRLRSADRKGVMMATRSAEPATNERIVRLLEEVRAQLMDESGGRSRSRETLRDC
jgi:hypothetical protein